MSGPGTTPGCAQPWWRGASSSPPSPAATCAGQRPLAAGLMHGAPLLTRLLWPEHWIQKHWVPRVVDEETHPRPFLWPQGPASLLLALLVFRVHAPTPGHTLCSVPSPCPRLRPIFLGPSCPGPEAPPSPCFASWAVCVESLGWASLSAWVALGRGRASAQERLPPELGPLLDHCGRSRVAAGEGVLPSLGGALLGSGFHFPV